MMVSGWWDGAGLLHSMLGPALLLCSASKQKPLSGPTSRRLHHCCPAMLRLQVRFTSHVLDKNAALLGKIPELQGLARELRALVASNTTAGGGAALGGAAGSAGGSGGLDQGSGAGLGGGEDCRGQGGGGAVVVGLDRCGAGPSAGQDVASYALRSRPAIS